MGYGIFIAVKGGEGGTISASNSETNWSTSSSSIKGYSGFGSGETRFVATPDRGYEFSYFDVYISSSETYGSGSHFKDYTDNPLTLLNALPGDGGSFRVRAVFESTAQYYTVTVNVYRDGTNYSSNSYTVEEGDSFDTSYYVSTPSNSRFEYMYYNGQSYSYYPSFTIWGNTTISVYYKSRPSSWSWTNTIAKGYQIKISASEWNAFTISINEFRAYVGLPQYSFTRVTSGTAISPTICNQAHSAINDLRGYQSSYSMPSSLTTPGDLPASFFTGITNVMNAVY